MKLFCWHKWDEVKGDGINRYRRCDKCGSSKYFNWNIEGNPWRLCKSISKNQWIIFKMKENL